MHAFPSRADRWLLAITSVAVAACSDEPSGLKKLPTPKPHASSAVNVIMVTNKSGGTDVGSLRWAASSGFGGTIQFDPSLAGDSIMLESTVVVTGNKIIEGPADKGITIKMPYYTGRVIHVPNGAALTVRNATIAGGSSDRGSGILSEGFVPLTLEHTTVRGNTGAAAIEGYDVILLNSTVSGNTGSLIASGIIYDHSLQLNHSTVVMNGPAPGIGGYSSPYRPASATLYNSIIASNGTPLKNCFDTAGVFLGAANISNDTSCGTSANMIIGSPQLYSLANNGGPTMTHGLAFDSPAINAGLYCGMTRVDQRYIARDAKCDIGAFEFTDFTRVTITVNANANVDATGAAVVTGTVQCTRFGAIPLGVQLNQTQKVGKATTVVRGSATATVNCSTSPQPWSMTATPWSGTFLGGPAAATAFTPNPPVWVTPASVDKAIKLFRTK